MSPRGCSRRLRALLILPTLVALAAMSVSSAAATTLPTLSLTLSKTSITVSGSTVSGAVNVVSTAIGVKEGSTILLLLKPGVTVAEVEAAIKTGAGKDPNRASKYASIVFDAEASAGKTSEVQTDLVPGQYVALGASGEGAPKVKMPFTVTAAASPAVLPTRRP
jgi:hypothetical protein